MRASRVCFGVAWLALVGGLSACAAAPQPSAGSAPSSGGWVSLFNGRDLSGWRPNRQPASYSVRDGILRVQAVDESSHLFYVDTLRDGFVRLKNFELEIEARSEPGSNSGIYLHSDPASAAGTKHHLGKGYEVQLNSSAQERRKTGSLYAVVDLDRSPVDETVWFTMRIRVHGKRIGVWLDDRQVVDYAESDTTQRAAQRAGRLLDPSGGGIAIQAHDPNSVFYFRRIMLRTLPDA